MTVPAELQAGDALVYDDRILHGGGANTTRDGWHHAMHLSFIAGWIVPEESCPIDYTDEEAAVSIAPRAASAGSPLVQAGPETLAAEACGSAM